MDSTGRSTFVTSRPVAVLMVVSAAVVFGLLSLGRLPVTLMPELTYPTLTVRTEYPGAAPEEVENDIGRPIEEALGVVAGIAEISSINRAGVSDVVLEFTWDTDIADATQDVLEKLDRVFLPVEAERPLILHFDPSLDPILELSLSGEGERFEGEVGLRRLRRLAELQLKRELEPIKGVAAVRIRGGLEEEIHVKLDAGALRRSGISIQQVINRLAQENINVAGGTLKEGQIEYLVRTVNEFENLAEIGDTIVASPDGRDIRIKDIGTVLYAHKEREILTRTNGGESVQIDIFKEADANIVAVAQYIKTLVGRFDPEAEETAAPSGLAQNFYKQEGAVLEVVADRSLFIESSINEVRNTAMLGGLLAILILYLFLRNFKSTAIIAVSIPIALAITFAPLNLLDVSLNIMSLGGLALGIGMLVDSSIVVLESIYRCREEGDDIIKAAERGTAEVRSAVVASTLTSIAVFFPMVFVVGIAGQAFGDLGLAVVFSLLAALGVALFFIPMLASRRGLDMSQMSRINKSSFTKYFSIKAFTGAFRTWPNFYHKRFRLKSWQMPLYLVIWPAQYLIVPLLAAIYWTVRLIIGLVFEILLKLFMGVVWLIVSAIRWVLFPVLGAAFWAVLWVPKKLTDWTMRFLQHSYPGILRSAIAHPSLVILVVLACLWGTWQVASSLDSELLPEVYQGEFSVEVALPVGTPLDATDAVVAPIEASILEEKMNIESLILTVGYDSANSQRSDEGEHTARFKILMTREAHGELAEKALISRLRQTFAGIPDLDVRIVRPVLFSSKTPIVVEVHGNDLRDIKDYGDRVKAIMETMPELADVETTMRTGSPEVQIVYRRDRLARYGLNIGDVARNIRNKVKGFEATRFNLQDRRIPILVRLGMDDRETVEDVAGIIVNPGAERPIPLSAVADVTLGEGPSEVRRVDGRRVSLVQANLGDGSLSGAADMIRTELSSRIDWPADVSFVISGQNEEWEKSQRSLILALALSLFLVYVIMAAQFESLTHPLVIMLTIPLAFVGTVITLKVLGMNLSIVVFLGMIMLAGIVVNNAIVLVDYINTLRKRDIPRDEAIITAGTVRLRPILMTTATTVLGLMPLALGFGDGAELRSPMAIAVISGLISSTALTLVVVPTIYAVLDTLIARLFSSSRVKVSTPGRPQLDARDGESVTS
jgi:HAE1 family hydrophobic/amphiphilic exporter-1